MARAALLPEPWEQQPTEGARAFASFRAYRDMPAPRSLRGLAAQLGLNQKTLTEQSSRWGWQTRVAAYDAMLDRKRVNDQVAAIRAMNDRYARAAQLLHTRIAEKLVGMEKTDLTLSQAISYLPMAQQVEMRARGVATEVVDIGGSNGFTRFDADPEAEQLVNRLVERLSTGAGLTGGPGETGE